jgi:hypothetical protein
MAEITTETVLVNTSTRTVTPLSNLEKQQKEERIIMADLDTQMLANQHADIRREAAEHTSELRFNLAERTGDVRREIAAGIDKTGDLISGNSATIMREQQRQTFELSRQSGEETNEIVKEGLKGDFNTVNAVKDGRFETISRVESNADRIERAITDSNFNLSSRVENAADRTERAIADSNFNLSSRVENAADRAERGVSALSSAVADRFFTVGRDLMELHQGQATIGKDIELNTLKTQIEGQKNTQYIADKISADGEKTRGLIQDLKYHDLNRGLVERNAELVTSEHERRHNRERYHDGRFDNLQHQYAAQWAQMSSQVQAFQSQLQETRQGMNNFGTMLGTTQSSTSNSVR